jgi:hypothetical protein
MLMIFSRGQSMRLPLASLRFCHCIANERYLRPGRVRPVRVGCFYEFPECGWCSHLRMQIR